MMNKSKVFCFFWTTEKVTAFSFIFYKREEKRSGKVDWGRVKENIFDLFVLSVFRNTNIILSFFLFWQNWKAFYLLIARVHSKDVKLQAIVPSGSRQNHLKSLPCSDTKSGTFLANPWCAICVLVIWNRKFLTSVMN